MLQVKNIVGSALYCKKCDRKFGTFQKLERHMNRKIPCDRVLKYERCNKVFTQMCHLKKHQGRKTPCEPIQGNVAVKSDTNECVYCHKIFKSKYNVKAHYNICRIKDADPEILFMEITKLKEENKKLKDGLKASSSDFGIVYFVNAENTSMFKIGYTKQSIDKRLSGLQTGCPMKLLIYRTVSCVDPNILERYLHECFNDKKIRGEWFDVTDDEVDNLADFLQKS